MPSQQQRDEGDTGAARRGPNPLVCEMFQGLNTVTSRPGVPDQQMYWCDGWMPLAPRKLRTHYGVGPNFYTTSGGLTVLAFGFYNIGSTPYMWVVQSDGSLIQVRTTDGAITTILAAGGLGNPTIGHFAFTQYGQQYLLGVSGGYAVWDGSLLYGGGFGSLAPTITLTNPGSGYATVPSVQFTGGNPTTAAAASATVQGGLVTNVMITNSGIGYKSNPTISFVGGQQTGTGASLTAHLSSITGGSGAAATPNFASAFPFPTITQYQLNSISVSPGGSGYSSATVATWNNPPGRGNPSDNQWTGPGGQPALTVTVVGGVVTAITAVGQGTTNSLWNTLTSSPQFPTITITDQASGQFTVTSVTGTPTGSGYSPQTTIAVSGGGSPVTQATITPIITGGVITGTTIVNGGVYGSNTAPTLTVNDVAIMAAATCSLMPVGVGGNAIATYAGHVWIANGNKVQLSAPGSVSDFATSDGGGLFTSSDSFLRVGYTAMVQTNGFLFLIGDSSMNYISGVQTNTPMGGNPTTTFTNNNSDPEIGTPYPFTVTTFEQDIFLANSAGVFVSSGGTFQKKSTPLDGVFNSVANFGGAQLSSAKATIFGQRVWIVLVPILNPITGSSENRLFMFNGQFWWSSLQDKTLTFIAGQEINSVFTAWGTDGTNIFQLFNQPASFAKVMQTRLWDAPAGYDHTKSCVRLFALAEFLNVTNASYTVSIDNEFGVGSNTYTGAIVGSPGANTQVVLPPTAIGQVGTLTGMTVTTTANDMVLISLMMQDEVVQYRG